MGPLLDQSESMGVVRNFTQHFHLGSSPACSRRCVIWLRPAESGPQPCSGRLMTPAAGWRGASMSIHMYQRRRSLARRFGGTMAQPDTHPPTLLSFQLVTVARPVVRLVARPVVRLVARPVHHRRSPAAPGP
jgi:hypothetical protein